MLPRNDGFMQGTRHRKDSRHRNLFRLQRQREIGLLERAQSVYHSHPSLALRLACVDEFTEHEGCINRLAWNEAGTLLATVSDDCKAGITEFYNGELGETKAYATGHLNNIFGVRFLPSTNSTKLATCSMDYDVRLTDLEMATSTRCHSYVWRGHTGRAMGVDVEPQNPNVFWSVSEDGTCRQVDLRAQHGGTLETSNVDSHDRHTRVELLYQQRRIDRSLHDVPNVLVLGQPLVDQHSIVQNRTGWNSGDKAVVFKCMAVNQLNPCYIAIGSTDCHIRLYDRRMLSLTRRRECSTRKDLSPIEVFSPYAMATSTDSPHICDDADPSSVHLLYRVLQDAANPFIGCTFVQFSPNGRQILGTFSASPMCLFNINSHQFDMGSVRLREEPCDKQTSSHTWSLYPSLLELKRPGGVLSDLPPSSVNEIIRMRLEGNTHYQDGEYCEAIARYNRALLACTPNSMSVPDIMSVAKDKFGAAYQELLRRNEPNNFLLSVLYGNRSMAYKKRGWQGDLERSLYDCERSLYYAPDALKSQHRKVCLLRDLERYKDAMEYINATPLVREKFPELCKEINTRASQRQGRDNPGSDGDDEDAGVSDCAVGDSDQNGDLVPGSLRDASEDLSMQDPVSTEPERSSRSARELAQRNRRRWLMRMLSFLRARRDARRAVARRSGGSSQMSDTSMSDSPDSQDNASAGSSEPIRVRGELLVTSDSNTGRYQEYRFRSSVGNESGQDPETSDANEAGGNVDHLGSAIPAVGSTSGDDGRSIPTPLVTSPIQVFVGHGNTQTDIKECSFWGESGEFVMAASDDGCVYMYHTYNGSIARILRDADGSICNCARPNPHFPILVTSGIDPTAKLWRPSEDFARENAFCLSDDDDDDSSDDEIEREYQDTLMVNVQPGDVPRIRELQNAGARGVPVEFPPAMLQQIFQAVEGNQRPQCPPS